MKIVEHDRGYIELETPYGHKLTVIAYSNKGFILALGEDGEQGHVIVRLGNEQAVLVPDSNVRVRA